MQKQIKFLELPHEVQIEIIKTLYFYKECHIEHANGKTKVCTSYALTAKYAEDFWISEEFTREDLNIRFSGNDAWFDAWNALEQKHHKKWADIEDEAKKECSSDFDKTIEAKAEEELKRITEEAR